MQFCRTDINCVPSDTNTVDILANVFLYWLVFVWFELVFEMWGLVNLKMSWSSCRVYIVMAAWCRHTMSHKLSWSWRSALSQCSFWFIPRRLLMIGSLPVQFKAPGVWEVRGVSGLVGPADLSVQRACRSSGLVGPAGSSVQRAAAILLREPRVMSSGRARFVSSCFAPLRR